MVNNMSKSSSESGEKTAFNALGDIDVKRLKVVPPIVMILANILVANKID
jgi:hypothetical protein